MDAIGGAFLVPQRSVLIVDQSSESREVLRCALQRGGTQIFEAAQAEEGLEKIRLHRPDLIVVDVESEGTDSQATAREFGETAQTNNTPLVVLATARRQATPLASSEFIAKPYHYGPLIRRIEELLEKC
jgi:CheY-like chemotaxis protein